jgi:hypothetical protein
MFYHHGPQWDDYLYFFRDFWEMIRGRVDYYNHEDGEDDHNHWYEMYDDPEQDEDGGTRLEPWELFNEDGEAAASNDWVA